MEPNVKGVNIAGDYSVKGVDIAPDAMTESDYEGEVSNLESMETIEPDATGQMSPADADHMRRQREKAESRLVNPSSNSNANTDWPTDE